MMTSRNQLSVPLRSAAIGLAAGFAGTAAMTASQKLEMRITGREASTSPAEAICTILGFETRSDGQESRLATEVHWAYGTALGLGQLAVRGLPEPARTLAYAASVWSAGTALVTATGTASPPTRWGAKAFATDLMHHLVYASVAGAVGHFLARRTPARRSMSAADGA